MPRFVRIGNDVVHIPSVANLTMSRSCMRRPVLTIYYHNHRIQSVSYPWGKWDLCEKDMMAIKSAMMEIEKVLVSVPLTEPDPFVSAVPVSSA